MGGGRRHSPLRAEFAAELKGSGGPALVATKYVPQPWRFTADSVVGACRASLGRLQLDQMALYLIHWPGFALNAFSNDAYLEGLARCAEQGLTRAVGVSNFNAQRLRNAARVLESRGTSLQPGGVPNSRRRWWRPSS